MAFIANQGIAPKGDRYDRSALVNDIEGKLYKRTEKGDFIYSSNNLETGSIGLNKYGNACISPVYSIFQPSGVADSDFLGRRLVRKDFIQEMVKWRQGVIYGQWRIHEADFLRLNIAAPSVDEQRLIGKLLDNLDALITLHQRKYDKLCTVKKSMLDKMFPKPGETEPEIRFEGFTDPWEQRKLGDVATIVGGGTPNTNNDAYWDGDIDWYSPAELGEQVYADRSVRRITQAGYDSCSATLLPAGKTILFTSRAGIGNTAILRRSACTNQGFQSLVVNDDTDVYFVYSMTDRIKKFAEQKASGSTFLEISGKGLAAGEFAFPSKDEQTAIGSMFKQLDHLITLHQRKLELLRNIKKSLLDRMFV